MKINSFLIFLNFLIFSGLSFSQNTLKEFYDKEQRDGSINASIKYQDKIIFVGASFETSYKPGLICVDTNGIVIWNSILSDTSTYNYYLPSGNNIQNKIVLGSDGNLYTSGKKNGIIEYWKINPNNGQIIWKKLLPNSIYSVQHLIDYSTNKFLMTYDESYNGMTSEKKLVLIDKMTGLITDTKFLGNFPYQTQRFAVAIDPNKNIYCSINDTIKKLNALNIGNVLWQVKYSPVVLNNFYEIHFNTIDNKLIAFAESNQWQQMHILKIDANTGSLNATTPIQLNEERISQITERNNFLYVSFIHNYVGGINTNFSLLKYDLINHNVQWFTQYDFYDNDEQGIFSFDFDANDNIYCTGSCSSINGPARNWAFLKINNSGQVSFSKLIFRGIDESSGYSQGATCSVIDGKPCLLGTFIGEFGTCPNNFFVRIDAQNGNFEKKVAIAANLVKFGSSFTELKKISNNRILAVLKVGKNSQIICYDDHLNELWNKKIGGSGEERIYSIDENSNGEFWFQNLSKSGTYTPPYFGSIVDNEFNTLSSNGENVSSYTESNPLNLTNLPYEVFSLGTEGNFIYKSGTDIKLKKFDPYMVDNNLYFSSLLKLNNNYVARVSSTDVFLVGNAAPDIKIFKCAQGQSFYYLGIINLSGATAHCATALNSNQVLIGAKSSATQAMMLKFDITTSDTLWSYTEFMSGGETPVKIVLSENNSSSYYLTALSNKMIIRKIDVSNGHLIWKKTFNGTMTNANEGVDIEFDPIRKQIIVGGFDNLSNNKVPLILKLDTLGNFIDTLRILNSQNYNAGGIDKLEVMSSGLIVAGGKYYSPNVGQCAFIYTVNKPLVHMYDTIEGCSNYIWPINNSSYSLSGNYSYCSYNNQDTMFHLHFIAGPLNPIVVSNNFITPTDISGCNGNASMSLSGNSDFNIEIDNSFQINDISSTVLLSNLCEGTHNIHIADNCGDTLNYQIVIPIDSNYVFNNPFLDSLAQDSLGVTMTNCDIYYNGIDTAYIDSIWANGNTVNVIWNIVDSNGSNFDTTSYVLNNGNGVYWLQLSVFCPNKAFGDYFAVTEAIYFNNGSVSTAGLGENELNNIGLFPNPTSEIVTISMNAPSANLRIHDIQGKLVAEQHVVSGSEISLKEFQTGVYLFEVISEGNRTVKRVVKN